MSNAPFFARFLDSLEMQQIVGGDGGGRPSGNAAAAALAHNPNARESGLVTLKAGTCGNDCDHPGGGASIFGH